MRMRNKKHGAERIEACRAFKITDPGLLKTPALIFGREAPIHLEIGCGKGSFACRMADAHPDWDFIAMERIPNVACNALENAKARMESEQSKQDNLRILIGNAANLQEWFAPGSVDTIYLNFSDPWPKSGHAKRRLTHPAFLKIYQTVLKPSGILRFKTDNRDLFDFSLESFRKFGLKTIFVSYDLHNDSGEYAQTNIMTEYEKNFSEKGFPIHMAVVQF